MCVLLMPLVYALLLCADERKVDKTIKTGKAIAEQQKKMALEPAGGDAMKVLSTMQDNAPANRKAMRHLDEEFPT